MLNNDELRILFEREGISEFFNVIDAYYLESAKATIYELENDYYAAIFRIFPPAYAGEQTEKIIESAISCGLPINSIIQLHQISSRNIEDHKHSFKSFIKEDIDSLKLEYPEMLKELHEAGLEFLNRHVENTVFESSKLSFYLRDFVNTATIMMPMRNEAGHQLKEEDVISALNKFKGAIYNLYPIDMGEHRYIRLMRELITPYNPQFNMHRDQTVDIRDHFTDRNSVCINEGKGVIRLCPSTEIEFEGQTQEFKEQKPGLVEKLKYQFNRFMGNVKELDEEESQEVENNKKSWYVKVLSKKTFPEYTDLNTMVDLTMDYMDMHVEQVIPLPYMVALTIVVEDEKKLTDSVEAGSLWNKSQLQKLGRLGEFFPELKQRAEESDNVLQIIKRYGDTPVKINFKMIVYSDDREKLTYTVSQIKSNFQQKSFVVQEEDLYALVEFLYGMPMKYDPIYMPHSRRFNTVFKSNVAAVAPLGTDSRGFGDRGIIQLFGRNGQPQNFDLFSKDALNRNAIVTAGSGSGKSFFISRLIWSYLKTGAKIRVIDQGHSYKQLCSLVGGQYITFPDNNDICLNPFSEAVVDHDGNLHEDEIANITKLVGIMAGYDLAEAERNEDVEIVNTITSYISEAVYRAFEAEGHNAGMRDVGDALRNKLKHIKETATVEGSIRDTDIDIRLPNLITALSEFISPNGNYYRYVNGKANITFSSSLVVLDLDDLVSKSPRFKDFVLSTITNAIEREFYVERKDNINKILIIDEAFSLLGGKVSSIILNLYLKARKLKGSIITITQSLDHYFLNKNIEGIFQNAFFKLFLEQDPSAVASAIEEKRFIIDPYAFELLKSVKTRKGVFSEVMVLAQQNDLMIGRVLATKMEYWVNVQPDSEEEYTYIINVGNTFGLTETKARLAIGYSQGNNITIEEAVAKILGYEDRAIDELIEEKVS